MRKVLSLLLVTVLIFFTFCSCESVVPETLKNTSTVNELDLLRQVPDEDYIEPVSLYYKGVRSVALNRNFLYASVFDAQDGNHPEKLIVYNTTNAMQTTLFEVESAESEAEVIDYIHADDNWVVWATVQRMSGSFVSIYAMNISTKEISLVKQMNYNSSYDSGPAYDHGKIFWKDTVNGTATVYQYDCETKKTIVISEIKNITDENLELSADKGKVVWYDCVNLKGTYFVYDIVTGKTDTVETQAVRVADISCHNGRIYSVQEGDVTVIDPDKNEVVNLDVSADELHVTDNYFVTCVGNITDFYYYENGDMGKTVSNLQELTRYYVSERNVADDNTVILVSDNEGYHQDSAYKPLEYSMIHIYKLNDMKS